MHPYATDSSERRFVPFVMAAFAIAFGFLVHAIVEATSLSPPWWLDLPTPLALYGLLWLGFDRIAWRWPISRKLGMVRVPDYSGRWSAKGRSDYDAETTFAGTATIRQTWTAISVELETELSRSHSISASLLVDASVRPRLTYEYLNEPRALAVATLQAHRGTAWLELAAGGALEGEYYGGRGSKNGGWLALTRSQV